MPQSIIGAVNDLPANRPSYNNPIVFWNLRLASQGQRVRPSGIFSNWSVLTPPIPPITGRCRIPGDGIPLLLNGKFSHLSTPD